MGDPSAWTLSAPEAIAAVLVSYLIGSIPFGMIVTRLGGLGDIREIGSGNIGATNVLRTGNKALAAATLLLDSAKGAAGVFVGGLFGPDAVLLAAVATALGHMYPVWLKFRGGKGVATGWGVLTMLAWPSGLIVAAVWLAVALTFRISSLSALMAAAAAPFHIWYFAGPWTALASAVVSALVWLRHRHNIARLLRGEEPRIGKKS